MRSSSEGNDGSGSRLALAVVIIVALLAAPEQHAAARATLFATVKGA
jgi:hypothetical protein